MLWTLTESENKKQKNNFYGIVNVRKLAINHANTGNSWICFQQWQHNLCFWCLSTRNTLSIRPHKAAYCEGRQCGRIACWRQDYVHMHMNYHCQCCSRKMFVNQRAYQAVSTTRLTTRLSTMVPALITTLANTPIVLGMVNHQHRTIRTTVVQSLQS